MAGLALPACGFFCTLNRMFPVISSLKGGPCSKYLAVLFTCLRVFAQPDNDLFDNRTVLTTDVAMAGTLMEATRAAGEPIGQVSAWWSFTRPRTTYLRVIMRKAVENSGKLPGINLYRGSARTNLESVSSSPETDDDEKVMVYRITANQPYALAAMAERGSRAQFTISIEDLPGSESVPGLTGETLAVDGDTTGQEPPFHMLFPTGRETEPSIPVPAAAWWWQSARRGTAQIEAREGTARDVELWIRDGEGKSPRFINGSLEVEPFKNYLFSFHSSTGQEGTFQWTLTFTNSPIVDVHSARLLGARADWPRYMPMTVTVTNLPAQPLKEIVFYVDTVAVQTNLPTEISITWLPTNSVHQFTADVIGSTGLVWRAQGFTQRFGPENDLFSHAVELVSGGPEAPVALVTATREDREPTPAKRTVWYRWTAESNCIARVTLGQTSITNNVFVFRGPDLASLEGISAVARRESTRTHYDFDAQAGFTYSITVTYGDNLVAPGSKISLTTGRVPPNDNMADAELLLMNGNEVTARPDLLFATRETAERGVDQYNASHSVWYSWSNELSGELEFTKPRTDSLAPIIGVYVVSTNGVRPVPPGDEFATSEKARALVIAGTNYQISLDAVPMGSPPIWGEVTMTVRFIPAPVNDLFENRILLAGESVEISGTLKAAHGESAGPAAVRGTALGSLLALGRRAVWYEWEAPAAGDVSLVRIGGLAQVGVFEGTDLTNLVSVAPFSTGARFAAVAGKKYVLCSRQDERIAGQDFHAILTTGPPSNDQFANRAVLPAQRGNFTVIQERATVEPGEPPGLTNSVWWTWTAPRNGWASFLAGRDAEFHVFRGSDLAALTPVPLAVFPAVRRVSFSSVFDLSGFEAEAGLTYQIAVSGTNLLNGNSVEFDLTSLLFAGRDVEERMDSDRSMELSHGQIDAEVDGTFTGPFMLAEYAGGTRWIFETNATGNFIYTNQTVGRNLLVIVAINTEGAERRSKPVSITIVPPNDNFSRAAPAESAFTDGGDWLRFEESSVEPGEPISGSDPSLGTRWWKWTAPATGDARVRLRYGFGMDEGEVQFGLFTGGSAQTLTRVPFQSKSQDSIRDFTFSTERGRTYYFQLAANDSLGIYWYQFSWSPIRIPAWTQQVITNDFTTIPVVLDWPPGEVERVEWFTEFGEEAIGVSFEPPFAATFRYRGGRIRPEVLLRNGTRLPSQAILAAEWRVANDNYAGRERIVDNATRFVVSTGPYTREEGEPAHGLADETGTAWWSWIAPTNGILQVAPVNSGDVVAVYGGSLSNWIGSGQQLEAAVRSGETYDIALCTTNGYCGLEIRFAPSVAPAVDELPAESGRILIRFNEPRRPGIEYQTNRFRWTPAHDGIVVFHGEELFNWFPPKLIADGAAIQEHNWERMIAYEVAGGRTYDIQFAGNAVYLENALWTYSLHPVKTNDSLATAFDLPAEVENMPCFERGGSWESGEPSLPLTTAVVWFRWQAVRSGPVIVETKRSSGFVYRTNFFGLEQVGKDGDFSAEEGETYYIAVAQQLGIPPLNHGPDMAFLTVKYPAKTVPNDDWINAAVIGGPSARLRANTRQTTREFGEPDHAGIYSVRTAWWKWTAPANGRVRLASLPAPLNPPKDVNHQFAIYRGTSVTNLLPVAARSFEDIGGDIVFEAERSVEYSISVAGLLDTELETDLHFDFAAAQAMAAHFEAVNVSSGGLRLRIRGESGTSYQLQRSTELETWSAASNGIFPVSGSEIVEVPRDVTGGMFFRIAQP